MMFCHKKYFFDIKYLHANVSPLCIQSIGMFLKLIWEEMNSSYKHYNSLESFGA